MAINSRRKGHDFERDIVQMLNQYYGIKEETYKWKRVPQSGGFDKRNFPGDVYTMHPHLATAKKFSIECKFHKDWKLEDLINGNKPSIQEWWDQARTDAEIGGKCPLLLFKKNRSSIYFMAVDRDIEPYLIYKNTYDIPMLKYRNRVKGRFQPLLEAMVQYELDMGNYEEQNHQSED